MADYPLVKVEDLYYVQGLKDDWSDDDRTMLLVRYDEGDCDTVSEPGERMFRALYDLFQTSDVLKEGDTFSLAGVPAFRCIGVDVVRLTDGGPM